MKRFDEKTKTFLIYLKFIHVFLGGVKLKLIFLSQMQNSIVSPIKKDLRHKSIINIIITDYDC